MPVMEVDQAQADHLPEQGQVSIQEDRLQDRTVHLVEVQGQVVVVVTHLQDHLLHEAAVVGLQVVHQDAAPGKTKKQGHEKNNNSIASSSNIERESYSPG